MQCTDAEEYLLSITTLMNGFISRDGGHMKWRNHVEHNSEIKAGEVMT